MSVESESGPTTSQIRGTDSRPRDLAGSGDPELSGQGDALAEGRHSASTLHSVAKWAERVAAPSGAAVALLALIGWTYSNTYFAYFGVNSGILQYSLQEHLFRSGSVLLSYVTQLTFGAFVILMGHEVLRFYGGSLLDIFREIMFRWVRMHRYRRMVFSGVSFCVMATVTAAIFYVAPLLGATFAVLVIGSLSRSIPRRALSPITRPAVMMLLVLFLLGQTISQVRRDALSDAQSVDFDPVTLPAVTVFSKEFLDLPGSEIRATRIGIADVSPTWRYAGLRLLSYSNSRWFLLTGRIGGRLATVILPDSETVRVEVIR